MLKRIGDVPDFTSHLAEEVRLITIYSRVQKPDVKKEIIEYGHTLACPV